MPYTQNRNRVDIVVGKGANLRHLGPADKWEGGDGDTDVSDWYTAAGQLKLPGNQTREDGTATFLVTETFWEAWKLMDRYRGAQMPVRATFVPTGDDGTPFASGGITLTGFVKTVPMPPSDYSSSEASAVGIVLTLNAPTA